ncbi:MAG TPA: hypothetical protein VGI57_04280, partial [Usitatibacter sp.]
MPAKTSTRLQLFTAFLVAASSLAGPAQGARPMYTDDARVVDPKSCQVESWVRFNRDSTEYWALPACNPFGFFELTYGGAGTRFDGESMVFTDNIVQAKTIFKPLEANGWGWGLAAGTDRHLHREVANGWPGDAYAYIPVSFSFNDDAQVVHINAGMVNRRDI